MKSIVISEPVKPVVPEERVILSLSLKEFAMFANLVYQYLGGRSDVRSSIETGLHEAEQKLTPENRDLYTKARTLSKSGGVWNSEILERVFE